MGEASKVPVPETMEGLRRQNSAYRALCASMEQTQARQTELGRKYQEAVTTLDSEREANAILTEEVTALSAQVEELREQITALAQIAAEQGRAELADLLNGIAKHKGAGA